MAPALNKLVVLALALALLISFLTASPTTACDRADHSGHTAESHSLEKRQNTCGKTANSNFFGASFSKTYMTFTGNKCPGYDWTGQKTPNTCQASCTVFNYPATVKINSSPLYVGVYTDLAQTKKNSNPVMGPIGMAINGVGLYGNSDAEKRDAYVNEGSSFDTCKGHCSIQSEYHYHTEPGAGCVYTDKTGQHSPLFGIMKDGIPIFGKYGDNGKIPTDLDECNMHVDATHPFPHYHVTANFKYPYLVNCLRGCVDGGSCSFTKTYNMTAYLQPLLKGLTDTGTCSASGPTVLQTTRKGVKATTTKKGAAAAKTTKKAPPPPMMKRALPRKAPRMAA